MSRPPPRKPRVPVRGDELDLEAPAPRKAEGKPPEPVKSATPPESPKAPPQEPETARRAASAPDGPYNEDEENRKRGCPKLIPTHTVVFNKTMRSILFGEFEEGKVYLGAKCRWLPGCWNVMSDSAKPHVYATSILSRDVVTKPL